MRISRGASAVLLVLAVVACGGSTDDAGPADNQREQPAAGGSLQSPLPAIAVYDATARQTVALDGFIPADRPTLVWFWAPH